MSWISAVTNAGQAMLAGAAGHSVIITRVVCGSAKTTSDLAALTALTSYKMDMSITAVSSSGSTNKVRVQLNSSNIAASFDLYQIGLYARLDNGSEVLIKVWQSDKGIPVPSSAEATNLTLDYTLSTTISNATSVSATLDTSAFVTVGNYQDLKENSFYKVKSGSGTLTAAGWIQNATTHLYEQTISDAAITAAMDVDVYINDADLPNAYIGAAKVTAIAGGFKVKVVVAPTANLGITYVVTSGASAFSTGGTLQAAITEHNTSAGAHFALFRDRIAITPPSQAILRKHYKQIMGYGNVSIPNNASGGVEAILSGVTRTNLIASSNMNTDSNADGVVDNFSISNGISATFLLNDSAQKISISNCSVNSGIARVKQGSLASQPCVAGTVCSARIEMKFVKTAGSPYAFLSLVFRSSSDAFLDGYDATVTSSTSGYIELKVENKTAPVNTAYVEIWGSLSTSVSASTTPETADVWFKNAMLEKAASVGNYISSGTKSTEAVRVKSVTKNLMPTNPDDWEQGGIDPATGINNVDANYLRAKKYYYIPQNTQLVNSCVSGFKIGRVYFFDRNKNYLTSTTINPFTPPSNAFYCRPVICYSVLATILPSAISTAKPQLELGTTATPYEPYYESIAYTPAIGRSVPNGTADKVNLLTGTDTDNTNKYALQASDITNIANGTYAQIITFKRPTNHVMYGISSDKLGDTTLGNYTQINTLTFDSAANIDCFTLRGSNTDIYLMVALGTHVNLAAAQSALAGTVIYYQLATPNTSDAVIYYFRDGKLADKFEDFPNGLVYTEPSYNGLMTSNPMIVTTSDKPIKSIRKVYRIDIVGGKPKAVDVTTNASTSDNLSISVSGYDTTKPYFYDCEPADGTSTNPGMTLNCEVNGGAVTHDYAAASAAWLLTDNESKAKTFRLTNAGAAANMVFMPTDGDTKIVRNTSGQIITIKTATSTGVTVANNKIATIYYSSTDSDFIKISEV